MFGKIQNDDNETKRNSHLFLGLIDSPNEPAQMIAVRNSAWWWTMKNPHIINVIFFMYYKEHNV